MDYSCGGGGTGSSVHRLAEAAAMALQENERQKMGDVTHKIELVECEHNSATTA